MESPVQTSSHCFIRPALVSDMSDVVDIHLKSFPGFFLTFLGSSFLSLLYENIQKDSEGLLLVAVSDAKVVGFVGGVLRQTGFYRRLIRQKAWAFAMATMGPLLRKPGIAFRLLRALKRPKDAEKSSSEACIVSIAVTPHVQGEGVGQSLVKAFCAELVGRGIHTVCLTTDHDNNDRTICFYRELGFQLVRTTVTPEGRALDEYMLNMLPEV